jgi:ubiquinol-cytochrome c reductase cytochrome b subunit
VILTLAGGNDVVALIFGVPVEAMTNILRVAIVVVPLLGFGITYRICRELRDPSATTPGRGEAVRLRRTPTGGFEEIEPD